MRDVILLFALGLMAIWVSRLSRRLAIQSDAVYYLIREFERLEGRADSLTTVVAARDSHTKN